MSNETDCRYTLDITQTATYVMDALPANIGTLDPLGRPITPGIVLYTDGGCKPSSQGIGGMGIHGYLYSTLTPVKGIGCKGASPTAYGYVNETNHGNTVTLLSYIDAYKSIRPPSTNNEAELVGLYNALRIIDATDLKQAHLILDSKYVLDGATNWVKGWERNGWRKSDGEPVSNAELWQEVAAMMDYMQNQNGVTLKWSWVKGHSDSLGNNKADFHATKGVISGGNGDFGEAYNWTTPQGYWNGTIDYNRMFNQPRWYFAPNVAPVQNMDRWVYYTGDHGSDDELFGKAISTSSFSVLHLKEQEPGIEVLRKAASEVLHDRVGDICAARMSAVMNPVIYEQLLAEGGKFLRKADMRMDLYTCTSELITRHVNPPRLAAQAINELTQLDLTLTRFRSDDLPPGYKLTEITDRLYETKPGKTAKSKPVHAMLIPDDDCWTTEIQYQLDGQEPASLKLLLVHGVDIPRYRSISALLPRLPRMWVLTWPESGIAFRYATIMTVEDDVSIMSGSYSNLRLVQPPKE